MLRVTKKEKNKDAEPAARLALIVDGKPEAVDLDYIDIHDVRWSKDHGYLQISYRLGYTDAGGVFRAAPGYEAVTYQIERQQQPALWRKYGLDTQDYFNRLELILHQELAITDAAIQRWKLADIETEMQ